MCLRRSILCSLCIQAARSPEELGARVLSTETTIAEAGLMDEEWGPKLATRWREDLEGDMSTATAVGVHLAVLAHHVKVPEHFMQREAFMRLVAYTRSA